MALMKATIGEALGLNGDSDEIDLLLRRIDALNKRMLTLVNEAIQAGTDVESNEDEFKDISTQIEQLNKRIDAIRKSQSLDTSYEQRLEIIQKTIDQRNKNSQTYDDSIVSQMVECIKVFRDGKLIIIFGGGYEVEEHI